MARATTKAELVQSANQQFSQLWELISAMPEQEQQSEFNFGGDFIAKQKEAHWTRDHNLRDVLIHLYEWHTLLLNWIEANQQGNTQPFIPVPYNWKTYGQLNIDFWTNHQTTPYQQAQEMLKKSHTEIMALINTLSNDELFTKKYFAWVGTSSLGSYFVSVTASHYDWAIKKIKIHRKTYQENL